MTTSADKNRTKPGALAVVVPSRGRPGNVARLCRAINDTVTNDSTMIVFGFDDDDPELRGNKEVVQNLLGRNSRYSMLVSPPRARVGMVSVVNTIGMMLAGRNNGWGVVGVMGDDHLPRTEGWDETLLAAAFGGIAYGNDLLQGGNLCTAAFLDARIPRALGYLAPPQLRHLYVDNVWMDWGRGIGHLNYQDDVVIEHVHPGANKAPWDAGYEAVNGRETAQRDLEQYHQYCGHRQPAEGQCALDVAAIREALA